MRMDCKGLDIAHPVDRIPPGYFPYLLNARVVTEGCIEGRPGYTGPANSVYPNYISVQSPPAVPNSVRRLNDPSGVYASGGYIYVGGAGNGLYAGVEASYIGVDTGYSGYPLSLIPFRPEGSPESWMYVYDENKMAKVRPDGVVRAIGVVPPSVAPNVEYVQPATVDIDTGQEGSGWTASGQLGPISYGEDRTNGASATIGAIVYNTGTTGWCCINPTLALSNTFWMGLRMKVVLGSIVPENVVVREIWQAIPNTTVQGIQYDVGNNGMCSVVLNLPIYAIPGGPTGLSRNSLIQIDSEIVRVLEVLVSPDGTAYSLRLSTTTTHGIGASVTGLLSWYCYTVRAHSVGETIASLFLESGTSASGTVGTLQSTVSVNAASAGGRPIDTANDYMHIALFLQNPQFVENIQLLISLDATPNFNFTNPGNTWIWTITQTQLAPSTGPVASGDSWIDLVIPISSGVRSGGDLTRTFADISGLAIQITTTQTLTVTQSSESITETEGVISTTETITGSTLTDNYCGLGFDWWYFFGTYGPTIQPNSPVGYVYASRFRDSSTNVYSVPGPTTLYSLFPLREGVIITPQTSPQAGVDSIDIYELGGSVDSLLYTSTIVNNAASSNSYIMSLPDSTVLELAQAPDLTALQPWPLLLEPISGICNVVGNSVVWVSGDLFNTALLDATAILINGTAYETYGQPTGISTLQLTQDAGVQSGVPFQISSPTAAGQPLPFAFGALEGPFAPVIFALGDLVNGGTLYFCNFSNADNASDANTLELASPSDNLVSGAIYNGICFAGNKDVCFMVRFSYLTTIGASNNTSFMWQKLPVPSGMWSRWTCCTGPDGVYYLGRDGIYKMTEQGAVNISDGQLYPIFPHDGQPAVGVPLLGANIPIYPVNMGCVDD